MKDRSNKQGKVQPHGLEGRGARRTTSPGKRPLTRALPSGSSRASAVQRKADRSAIQARAAETASWIGTAMRPDLHDPPVQRAAAGAIGGGELPADGAGKAMPVPVQAKMESAFGADFSAVRIHEGPRSQALGAHAYTQGADIHFAPGQYRPDSQTGQELLGHELAHVVQQSQGRVEATAQAKGVGINDDGALEREADEMGARAARGESVGTANSALAGPAGGVIQRAVDTAACTATAGGDYYIDPGDTHTLYSRRTAAEPRPNRLYLKENETANLGFGLHKWTPNVRFFSKAEQANIANPLVDTSLQVTGMADAVENPVVPEEAVRGPSMGALGKNDCAGFAGTLREMVAEEYAVEGIDNNDLDAEEVGVGDQMIHHFPEGSTCMYHGATVVAKDGASLVTLEAHVSKDLTRPEFHIRNGIVGFMADNQENSEIDLGDRHEIHRANINHDMLAMYKDSYDEVKTDPGGIDSGLSNTRVADFAEIERQPLRHQLLQRIKTTVDANWDPHTRFGSVPDGVVAIRGRLGAVRDGVEARRNQLVQVVNQAATSAGGTSLLRKQATSDFYDLVRVIDVDSADSMRAQLALLQTFHTDHF